MNLAAALSSSFSEDCVLRALLGPRRVANFLKCDYGHRPFAGQWEAGWAPPVVTWDLVEAATQGPPEDLLLVRDGAPWRGRPVTSLTQARACQQAGYTVVVRNADRYDEELRRVGCALAGELHGFLNLQVYFSPREGRSFGWHFDPEEVFLLQLAGEKRVVLRENTQFPAPLLETGAPRLRVERERAPIHEVALRPRGWLHIPAGHWHATHASAEGVSLSIGIMPPTLLDALSLVRSELIKSASWRARLPVLGRLSALDDEEKQRQCGELFAALAAEVASQLRAPSMVGRVLAASGYWAQRRNEQLSRKPRDA